MYDGKVIIDTALNNKGFVKGINLMKTQIGGLKDAVRQLGVAVGIAFGAKALVDFGKECVELGSNVAEVQNVVDVAFGEMKSQVEEFASGAIRNFGMSRLAAKKTASTYMAIAKDMGIADETAADMSITLAGLTGDVASFFNISQELADVKLKSVFTGETETLKDLGVVMTQANLKAYALSHGLSGNIEAMSQAQLVALRYNFVLDQLALANGDFARTADSWANQTRVLSMQWQEFMSIMGQALIQVLTPVVRVLNSIVSALISMANTLNSVVSGLFGGANTQIQQTAANAEAVGGAIKGSVDQQDALTDATKETTKAQKKMLAGFDEINKLSAGDAGSSGLSGAGAGSGIAVPPLQTVTVETTMGEGSAKVLGFFQDLQAAIQPTVDALGRLWEALKMVGGFAGDALTDFYNTFLVPVGSWVMGEGLPRFIDAVTNGLAAVDWQKINSALHDLWEALAPFAVNVGEGLLWLWENVLVPLGTWTMNEVVPLFLEILASAIDIANKIIEVAKPAFEWLWEKFLKPLAEFTGGIIITLLEDFHGWLEMIAGLLTGDFNRAVGGAEQIVKALGDRFTYVKELALLAWNYVKEDLSDVASWITKNVLTPVTEGFKGFVNGLIGYVEGFVNFFVRGINKVIDTVNALSFDIPDVMGGGTIGFNLPNVDEIKLPRLATGAVIPPNREFMAVLGDQTSGYNIEAPEDLIRKIVREESGGGMNTELLRAILEAIREGKVMMVDRDQFAKLVFSANKSESRRIGVSLAGE